MKESSTIHRALFRLTEIYRFSTRTELMYTFLMFILVVNRQRNKTKRAFLREVNKIYTELEQDYEAFEQTDEALKDMADRCQDDIGS